MKFGTHIRNVPIFTLFSSLNFVSCYDQYPWEIDTNEKPKIKIENSQKKKTNTARSYRIFLVTQNV